MVDEVALYKGAGREGCAMREDGRVRLNGSVETSLRQPFSVSEGRPCKFTITKGPFVERWLFVVLEDYREG
jgi:hypothetical protein